MKFINRLLPFSAFAPALVLAQGNFGQINTFFSLVLNFINDTLVPLVFAIAFLVFIWGVFKYFIQGGGDETKREAGKQLMLWGIIGFVLMVSVWGIVNILATGLFGTTESIQVIPNAPTSN